jgi:hypothetical protein
MHQKRTPPLSLEGSREVLDEMASPPKDTPQRRRTFEGARMMAALRERLAAAEESPEVKR